jgi:hypothetical protein
MDCRHLGIATFNLDAFTGRGIIDTGTDQERLGNLTMINDAYRRWKCW